MPRNRASTISGMLQTDMSRLGGPTMRSPTVLRAAMMRNTSPMMIRACLLRRGFIRYFQR